MTDITATYGLTVVCILVIVAVIVIVREQLKNKRSKQFLFRALMMQGNNNATQNTAEPCEKLPYRKKLLLTKNEYWFYKSLKETADKYGYGILTKIRLADLVEVSGEADRSEYMKYFAKIKAKHIDFILCKKENLYPELLIELNDNSHKAEDRIKRDEFVRKIAEKVGYKIIFVSGTQNLEELITKALEIKNTNNNDPPVTENTEEKQQ